MGRTLIIVLWYVFECDMYWERWDVWGFVVWVDVDVVVVVSGE